MNSKTTAAICVFVLLSAAVLNILVQLDRIQKCHDYGEATGREVKVLHAECYVRSGDHFVPREEYGR